jgi:5,5'-dehydrodivanillate O-demethylase
VLTQADNERLTRVGPGTPGGNLFRKYWQPIAPKQKLVEHGILPVRLYGEDLVLFLDGKGNTGLVGDRCAHRLVKLDCGYATDAGIRCPYHGWTYDTQGQCVEQPGEPAGSTFKDKVQIPSYRVEELAGIVFAYLGPKDAPVPLLPRWDRLVWDNCYRVIAYAVVPCNWLQCMENTPDVMHTLILHGEYAQEWLRSQGIAEDDSRMALARGFARSIVKHEYGPHKYGLHRAWLVEGQTGKNDTWSSSAPLVFPNTHVTSGSGRHDFGWRIPIDDTHTMQFVLRTFQPGNGVVVPPQAFIPYYEMPVQDDDGNFLTLDTINGQDFMAWSKQGAIMDRTRERLGDSDRGIIAYRQLLREQLARVEAGEDPINVFRDPVENRQIDLPVPWDRGHAWGYDKDGSYIRGAVTASDRLPEHIADEIEDLYVEAARRSRDLVPSGS